MTARRNLLSILAGLVSIMVIIACGSGSAGLAPVATEAPAEESSRPVPTTTAVINEHSEPVEELVDEPPPSTQKSGPQLLATPTLAAESLQVGGAEPAQPAIPESRRLILEYPPRMRSGDSLRVRMQLEVDQSGTIIPTAMVEGNVIKTEFFEIPNVYETHNVIAEARLDMAGMDVRPSGSIIEPMEPGQSVSFLWSVSPEEAGRYEGMVWLHLRFVSRSDGKTSRVPVSVQFIEIESSSFLGIFSEGMARGVGTIGSLLGGVLGFPFIDDAVKWVWRKIRR